MHPGSIGARFMLREELHCVAAIRMSSPAASASAWRSGAFPTSSVRVVEAGERDTVFEQPQHDYTPRLLAASPALSVTSEGFELQSRNRVAI